MLSQDNKTGINENKSNRLSYYFLIASLVGTVTTVTLGGCGDGKKFEDMNKIYSVQLSEENQETLENLINFSDLEEIRSNKKRIYGEAKIYENLSNNIKNKVKKWERPDWPQVAKAKFEAIKLYDGLVRANGSYSEESQNALMDIELDPVLYCSGKGTAFNLGKYKLKITDYEPTFCIDNIRQNSAIIGYQIIIDDKIIKKGKVDLSRRDYSLRDLLGEK
ncbi:MAG: hypothetical protein KAU20_03995 [Nanoarchaeota archaeon]|nr:hypothetical protein [Nanoarchaeota archaeon]